MRIIWRLMPYMFLAAGVSIIFMIYLQVKGGAEPSTSVVSASTPESITPPARLSTDVRYIEVVDGCGPYFDGTCLNARSGPGTSHTVVAKLRTGIVLKVDGVVTGGGHEWYRVVFDEWLRYPERVKDPWYVAARFVRPVTGKAAEESTGGTTETASKRIIVDRSEQMLYAYEGHDLFMQEKISTGLELTPTPRGTFKIFRKTPSRYMQGPIPQITQKEYDMPGVPWNLYFTKQGAVIHGAYWHDHFGEPWSNGCVNLPVQKARELYEWADLGTLVTVRD